MKIYLTSDLHIGLENSNYPKIIEFFNLVQKDADELIIVGDCLDVWVNTFKNITTQEPYKTAYDKLIETTSKVKTTLICGNHDYNLRQFIKNQNIKITNGFTRDNIRYEHGHRYDLPQLIASPFFEWIIVLFPYIYQRFFKGPSQIIDNPPEYHDRCVRYHNKVREVIADNNYSFFVCGHSHDGLIDDRLLDCGDFVLNATYIILEDGKAKLMSL